MFIFSPWSIHISRVLSKRISRRIGQLILCSYLLCFFILIFQAYSSSPLPNEAIIYSIIGKVLLVAASRLWNALSYLDLSSLNNNISFFQMVSLDYFIMHNEWIRCRFGCNIKVLQWSFLLIRCHYVVSTFNDHLDRISLGWAIFSLVLQVFQWCIYEFGNPIILLLVVFFLLFFSHYRFIKTARSSPTPKFKGVNILLLQSLSSTFIVSHRELLLA